MMRSESVTIATLDSGLRVVTEAMPHLSTAALGVWIVAGSRHEKPHEHGLAHLLEHMAFKGTKRRTARQIAEEIEAVGGDLNAETNVERTSYYVRLMGEDAPLALDMISDILTEPAFDPEELKREKEKIENDLKKTWEQKQKEADDIKKQLDKTKDTLKRNSTKAASGVSDTLKAIAVGFDAIKLVVSRFQS